MIKIAHRGNTKGPSIHENQLWYVQEAIDKGFDVEIDLWSIRNKLWLGHDSAQYLVSEEWLEERAGHLWIHCKNFEALNRMAAKGYLLNYFWHQVDDHTVTSWNWIWTYPGKEVGEHSIIVDLKNEGTYDCYGVCSDYWD